MDLSKFQEIEAKCLSQIQLEKNKEDIGSLTNAIVLIATMLFIAILGFFIKYGYQPIITIFLLILVFMFLLYKRSMNKAYALNKKFQNYLEYKEENETYISQLINYVDTGLHIKLTRLVLTKWFFIINFTLFLIVINMLFFERLELKAFAGTAILAFILSYLTWSFFYHFEITEVKALKDEITEMIRE